jgi:hypothetical protein
MRREHEVVDAARRDARNGMTMRNPSVAGFLIIMIVYAVALIGWLLYDGGAILEVVLFYLIGIPIAAAAVWWSGRTRQRRR